MLKDTKLEENTALVGGGLMVDKEAQVELNATTVQTNKAVSAEGAGNLSGIGGGVAVLNGSLDATAQGNILCNNTADFAAADVYTAGLVSDSTTSVKLPDAAAMNQVYAADKQNEKIDAWYSDPDDARYQPSRDGQAVDVSGELIDEQYLVASYKQGNKYTVTYTDGVDGEEIFPNQETNNLKFGDSTPLFKGTPVRDGYTFLGWEPAVAATVTGTVVYTAQWQRNGGGGGGTTTRYTLHYESNGGTEYDSERYTRNTEVRLEKVPVREGYTFTGWYADKDLTEKISTIKMTSNKTVYAGWEATGVPDWLNGADHFAYIIGDDEGYVRPLANVTRAETAAIFFRLLKEDVREEYLTDRSGFADVEQGAWYNKAVSTMAALGVVKGYTEDTFAPHEAITRAEFAAICARFDTGTSDGESSFTDISGHWAESEIRRAAQLGWIQGDPDGRFRPNAPITRAEAMTIINRVLNRLPEEKEDLLAGMKEWPDALPGAWYYLAVQEATNSHAYEGKGEVYERWTALNVNPDWAQYQR